LKAVKATPIVVPVETGRGQKIAALARDGTLLKAGDLVVEFDPWDAEKEAADGRADLAAAQAKIEKARVDGGKTKRSLTLDRDVAKEELSHAQLFSRNAVIESALDRELFAKKADVAERKLVRNGKLSAADRALAEIEAGKAQTKVGNAEKSLRALRIVAPHDGLLLLEKKWTGEPPFVGDSLWPGQKVAEIPDLSQLEAKVFVLEADAAGLKPGLAARLSIEGRPGGDFAASVVRVDPLAKPRDRQSPVKYFETVLALEKPDPSFMKPGQRVRAVIKLDEAEGVIAIPRGALFEKDGKRVVYRQESGDFVPVEVTVGRNSVSRIVVETGLHPGDHVALRDPSLKPARPNAGAAAGPGEAPR
jgi:HlyD family secretion protein